MSHEINNELPFPPRSEPYPDAIHRSEDILLLLLDGRAITGQLIRYSPSEPTIKLLHSVEKNLSSINISEIKTVELNNSRQFVKADDKLSLVDNASPLPQDRQEYEITFIDEQHISGETLGHVSDLHGIHLFLPQAFNNYHHVFIPFSAIKTHRIGPMIGELLVDSKTISDDDLNQGLQEQNRLRGQRIGDILRAEHIISKEQLEATVNKQVATKGSKVRIGEALLKEGIITEAQLDKALEKQKEDRSQHLGQILIGMKLVKPADIVRTLAAKLGIPFVNLRKFDI
ncbi:MAG: hypothetical protein OEZ58_10825, partial [Gammaproteobacteria bacterium]|nr:hypothetical protein [Gammaproteobacteria bacterium]